jgi:hypothetical protein
MTSFIQNSEKFLKNQFELESYGNQFKKKKYINIQLEIFSEILSKKESKNKCICHNHIKDIKNKNNVYIEKELIPNLEIIYIEQNENNFFVNLQYLVNEIKKLGFPLEGSNLSIFHPLIKEYVSFGFEPFDQNVFISNEYFYNNFIQIKIVNYIEYSLIEKSYKENENKKLIENDNNNCNIKIRNNELISIDEDDEYYDNYSKLDVNEENQSEEEELNIVKEEIEENNNSNNSTLTSLDKNKNYNNNNKKIISRRRERRIEYIIEKVYFWRKLLNGFYKNKVFLKFDSKKAAKIVGVSKKSLDEYTKLLRKGRKFNYDFNKNRNKRISHLKNFIKNNDKNL